jgi:Flavin containing amine oxidoreductase
VVTLPPTLAGRLEYDPPLPSWRDQLTQRMAAGSVIKTYAIYPEPFWREDGLNGQAASDVGPVKVAFDNSPPSGRPGVLMGFLEGKQARTWARRSEAERREAVTGYFIRYFGEAAGRPEQYLERDWMAEEFTRGLLRRALCTGSLDVLQRGVARTGRARPLGPAASVPSSATATWRAPSAAARPPPRRSPRSDNPWLPSTESHHITLTLCGIDPLSDPSTNSCRWPLAPPYHAICAPHAVPWPSSWVARIDGYLDCVPHRSVTLSDDRTAVYAAVVSPVCPATLPVQAGAPRRRYPYLCRSRRRVCYRGRRTSARS